MREVSAGMSAGVALRRVKLDLLDAGNCGCWRLLCHFPRAMRIGVLRLKYRMLGLGEFG